MAHRETSKSVGVGDEMSGRLASSEQLPTDDGAECCLKSAHSFVCVEQRTFTSCMVSAPCARSSCTSKKVQEGRFRARYTPGGHLH